MKKIILKTECPYCKCTKLKSIGFQYGAFYAYELANCTNKNCKPYTITISKTELSRKAA